MASKKKLPHSRRCNNSQNVAIYCYCADDEEDFSTQLCDDRCREASDFPDVVRAPRRPSDSSDHGHKYLYEPDHLDQERRRRELTPHDDHKPSKILHVGPPFYWFDVLVGLSSIGFFYFDVITDILLAIDYYHHENMWAFGLTAGFIIGPSIITCILNFRWYLLDYQSQQLLVKNYGKENVQQTSMVLWFTRFVSTLLMMAPVIRFVSYMDW